MFTTGWEAVLQTSQHLPYKLLGTKATCWQPNQSQGGFRCSTVYLFAANSPSDWQHPPANTRELTAEYALFPRDQQLPGDP